MSVRQELFQRGVERVNRWCELNRIHAPEVEKIPVDRFRFDVCAYYRPVKTRICLEKCALPGYGGRAWSWPGYVIDRTPYGVLAHELGHHVDFHRSYKRGSYYGDFSVALRRASGESKLTNYCPNDAEWFAEMFRLFVTNPDLLSKIRPITFGLFLKWGLVPIENKDWKQELQGAPQRTLDQAKKKIEAIGCKVRL